jgi:drug/metabolite transporter (DMT)-like permease
VGIGTAQALAAVVIWGGSFAGTKHLLSDLSATTLLFTRTVLGMLTIVVLLAARGRRLRVLPARTWPRLAALSLLGMVTTQLLQAWALGVSGSAKTAWLVAVNPVVTAAMAVVVLGESLRGKVLGLAVAFVGVLLVTGEGRPPAELMVLPSTRGDLLTLLSTLTFAYYTVLGRRQAIEGDPPILALHIIAFAALGYLPGFVASGGLQQLARLSAPEWLALVYLGAGCSGIAFFLYYLALEHLEASRAASFIYIEPLIAQVLGVLYMDEPLSAVVLAGGVAIVMGIYLVSRSAAPAALESARTRG